ncbi:MAG: exodeoxyribonuclease VII large subunit [Candidatus Hydrogenedentes bacterium]|nr:exodeoxyribonuclease VII large subunit [Candidatus Hydrogenedentota bacterium]
MTVSELTRRVKNLLEFEVGRVWVSGEISNWRVSPAGHSYFTLKDESSQLSAVMFKGKLARLPFEPEGGLEVIVRGLVTVYEQRGNYQILCDDMQPKGVGALQLAYEQLRNRLDAEGLFDEAHKKPLPMLPRRIGIVTSPTGAAIRDILNVIRRRYADVHILLYPARVQGDEAAAEIVEGIRTLDAYGVDVMIVGRGGGSLEDLWPFNEEAVVRAIYEAKTPVISAVGHEIDVTLCDFVADLRAPTPSAAAELVVQEQETLANTVRALRQRLAAAMLYEIESGRRRLEHVQRSVVFQRPEGLFREQRQHSDELRMRLEGAMASGLEDSRRRVDRAAHAMALLSPAKQVQHAAQQFAAFKQRLVQAGRASVDRRRAAFGPMVAQLDALSPLAILSRGYAIARKLPGNALVRDAVDLRPKDTLNLRFGRGGATVVVKEVEDETKEV